MQWERAFEFSVSIDRLWDAFIDWSWSTPWNHVFTGDPYYGRGSITVEETSRDEAGDQRHLSWVEKQGEQTIEMTVSFTSTETGARITMTRSGFGEGDAWLNSNAGRFLGWVESMEDFALFVEHGLKPVRHAPGGAGFMALGRLGFDLIPVPGGVSAGVVRGGIGAEAGVQPGDVILKINGAPVFGLSDFWLAQRLLEPGERVELVYLRDGAVASGTGIVPEPTARR